MNGPFHIYRHKYDAICDPLCFLCFLVLCFNLITLAYLLVFTLHVCTLTFPLSFVFYSYITSLPCSLSQNDLPYTIPKTLHFHTTTPSQRVSELLSWPVSEAELERALFPSTPELPAQTAKRELKIIEFMKKKDPRSPIFSGTRR